MRAATIDTTPSWNGVNYAHPFGEIDTATYGQTFEVGEENILENFSFFVDGFDDTDVVDFRGYVMEWDGSKATGEILFESDLYSSTPNTGFEEFNFATGGLRLTQGQDYVAFISASGEFDGEVGTAKVGRVGDAYGDGKFVFLNNGSDFSKVTQDNWSQLGAIDLEYQGTTYHIDMSCFDLAFSMVFSEEVVDVPEPASMLGLLTVGLAGSMLKRKKK